MCKGVCDRQGGEGCAAGGDAAYAWTRGPGEVDYSHIAEQRKAVQSAVCGVRLSRPFRRVDRRRAWSGLGVS